ncbi:hypothetical protein C2E23DRAFT_277348 [Lenzites betulinus]|nr:hypothetical protein C2E23DRAFT_277348 [Lenzites betulinus]
MQGPLSMHNSPFILELAGLGQRTLFSGISHTAADDGVHTQTRPFIASWSKTQQHRAVGLSTIHYATLRSSIYSPASSTSSMASSNSTEDEIDPGYASSSSSSSSASISATRVPLPLPFPPARVSNVVEFRMHGSRGVSLAEWIRLSEKKRTHLCLDNPNDSLDELIDDWRILYQNQWPGYDADTRYIAVPEAVAAGTAPLRKVDLLDMVCQALADWVLSTTRRRHTVCTEPQWAIGLDSITFKHIRVVSVVEVAGYVRKWVPVLEVDAEAFGP